VDDELPGTELTRTSGARVKIRARAQGHAQIGLPAVLQIEGSGGVLKEARSPQGETELAIDLEHTVGTSQWLMACVVCDNGALAHTTPVYVVVNGRPTWNPRRGPDLVDKQVAAIAKIEAEFAESNDDRAKGIRERLQRARDFYADLRKRMMA
jgi:hypothetical protein